MTIEKDLNIVLELLEASRASVCGLRQHRQHAWDRFENAAGEFFEDHGPALLVALADQRRYRFLRNNLLWAKSYDGYVRWAIEIGMPEPGINEHSPPVPETLDAAIDALILLPNKTWG